MKTLPLRTIVLHLALGAILCGGLSAQVPQIISYQGRVAVGTVNFDGSGSFKFALVNAADTTTYWSNDGTSAAGSEPTAAVSLTVTKGLYSVLLGDASLANMTAIPHSVFNNADVRLRVWFDDGSNGSQLLTPDQRIVAVGYAITAAGVQLPSTSGATAGVILQNNASFIHSYGTRNFFAGAGTGNFTLTGADNVAVGYGLLPVDTTGKQNTVLGSQAMTLNTTGQINTAIGFQALRDSVTANQCTAIGAYALANSDASNNTAVGYAALLSDVSNTSNTAIGWSSLRNLASGNSNTALGNATAENLTSGSGNIIIGSGAGSSLTVGSNNIDIGNAGVAGEGSTTRIGNGQTRAFIAGIRGVTTGNADAITVMIDSNGQLGTVSSSRRYKQNIRPMAEFGVRERLAKLRPVTFEYKQAQNGGGHPVQFGLIAEEVAEVFPELAVFNEEGEPETVKYHLLAPMLLGEMQGQRREIEARDAEIAELKQQLAELKARDTERDVREKEREARLAKLEQFIPKEPESKVVTAAHTDTKGE